MRVLVIDAIAPEGVAYLRERGLEVDEVPDTLPQGELHGRLGDYEASSRAPSTAVTSEFLARARTAAHPRARRRRRRQHRRRRVLAPGRDRGQRAVRQRGLGGRAHRGHAARAAAARSRVANDALKRFEWDRGIYGAELYRKTVGRARARQGRLTRRDAAARVRHGGARLRSVHPGEPRPRARRAARPTSSTLLAARRRRHRARAAHRRDGRHARRRRDRPDEARGAHRELRARRHRARGRAARPRSTRATWRAPPSTCGARSRPSRTW